jgi:hypothetical protein
MSEQPLLMTRTPEPAIILAPRKPPPDLATLARVLDRLVSLPCPS